MWDSEEAGRLTAPRRPAIRVLSGSFDLNCNRAEGMGDPSEDVDCTVASGRRYHV